MPSISAQRRNLQHAARIELQHEALGGGSDVRGRGGHAHSEFGRADEVVAHRILVPHLGANLPHTVCIIASPQRAMSGQEREPGREGAKT